MSMDRRLFDPGSSFSSSSIDIIAFDEVDCDSISLEDVGFEWFEILK